MAKRIGKREDDTKTRLLDTNDYITAAYGSIDIYKCEKCGCDDLLDNMNYCANCGREIVDSYED